MIVAYRKKSNLAAAVVLVALLGAIVCNTFNDSKQLALQLVVAVLVTTAGIAFCYSSWFYIKAKGRSGWWILLLVFNLVGILVLALLEDRARADQSEVVHAPVGFHRKWAGISVFDKLNGWQRLWVLASVVWLLPVGYYSSLKYPFAQPSLERFGLATCLFSDLYGKDEKRAINEVLPELSSFPEEGGPKNCPDLFEKIAKSGRADEVRQVYEQHLRESRLTFFVRAFAYWVIPVLLVYLLGAGIAWVLRGFPRRN